VRWKGQGEIRSGDYTVYYCGGDRAERGVAIIVHKIIVKNVVKKSVYSDNYCCYVEGKTSKNFDSASVHASIRV
jgi:hypothetical protein